MDIILLERIGKLGQMGDLVTVKNGYGRNFLLPQGKALRATKKNIEYFENQRTQLEARNLELKKEAEAVGSKVDGKSFIILRQAGESGQLYGSVATRDISQKVSEEGCSIERAQVLLDRPIKTLGLHSVRVSLHPEVKIGITINVARSEDEARRQSRGENVSGPDDDLDQETIDARDIFEDEELVARHAEKNLEEDAEEEGEKESTPQEDPSTADISADDGGEELSVENPAGKD